MNNAIIGIGSNIEPDTNIKKALGLINENYNIIKVSSFCKTKPIGVIDQADFINGAVLLETELNQDDFNEKLKFIEESLGRQKDADKYGPRTIDLDLIVWNEKIVDQDFYERDFIKNAVLELIPELVY